MNTVRGVDQHRPMELTQKDLKRLALVGLLVAGLVLTVLAVVASSVTIAWTAGAVTVGGALGLWR